ncbi:MAG: sigma-70 family RNA polymerase sigma factor [Gemmatimonadota bacterium]
MDARSDEQFAREALPFIDDVYRFALALTGTREDAEDAAQETFLRAYRSWHTYESGTECRRWLFTICRNVVRSRYGPIAQIELDAFDAESETMAAVLQHAELVREGADVVVDRALLGAAIDQAIAGLQEPYRSAVVLVDVHDQSYEAAAEVLGVPVGTIRSRLFRGRRILQGTLINFARDAGLRALKA